MWLSSSIIIRRWILLPVVSLLLLSHFCSTHPYWMDSQFKSLKYLFLSFKILFGLNLDFCTLTCMRICRRSCNFLGTKHLTKKLSIPKIIFQECSIFRSITSAVILIFLLLFDSRTHPGRKCSFYRSKWSERLVLSALALGSSATVAPCSNASLYKWKFHLGCFQQTGLS